MPFLTITSQAQATRLYSFSPPIDGLCLWLGQMERRLSVRRSLPKPVYSIVSEPPGLRSTVAIPKPHTPTLSRCS